MEIRGKSALEVWKKVLAHIVENGHEFTDRRRNLCKECLNITSVIENPKGVEKPLETLKLFNKISSDPKKLWHITDFNGIASEIVVKRRLKELVKKGVIIRLRTYPLFYKLNVERYV